MDDIDILIRAFARDLVGTDQGKPCLAINCEPDRRLLALLIAYQLGEELSNKVLGDENNA